jgi:hypothetical protein
MEKYSLESMVSKSKSFASGLGLAASLVYGNSQTPQIISHELVSPPTGAITNEGYHFITLSDQIRLYKDGDHFLSIIRRNEAGNSLFAIRTHTGDDVDSWSGTAYIQPRFRGAAPDFADSVTLNTVTNSGIPEVEINAHGRIPWPGGMYFAGNWSANINVNFDKQNKKVEANGQYEMNINNPAVENFYFAEIASNILLDVPLNDGTTGNSGDAKRVEYMGDAFTPVWYDDNIPGGIKWYPSLTNFGHFPNDFCTNYLEMRVIGNYNNVDTVRQDKGYKAISPSPKPSLSLEFKRATNSEPLNVHFGVFYDTNKSSYFAADNLLILPWVEPESLQSNYSFDIKIASESIPSDIYSKEFNITSTGETGKHHGIYISTNGFYDFTRAGSLNDMTNGTFTGKVKVNTPNVYIKTAKED